MPTLETCDICLCIFPSIAGRHDEMAEKWYCKHYDPDKVRLSHSTVESEEVVNSRIRGSSQ